MPPDPADLPVNPAFAEAFVLSCYRNILGRDPDAAGFAAQVAVIQSGQGLLNVLSGFCTSQEFTDKLAVKRLQRPFRAGETLYFYHLLKTGGTSFHTWLRGIFGQQLFPSIHKDELLAHHGALSQFSVFSGHFDGMLDRMIGGVSRKFTVIREPLDRAISQYFHHLYEAKARAAAADISPAPARSFAEALHDENWRRAYANNTQFRSLSRLLDSDQDPSIRDEIVIASQEVLLTEYFNPVMREFELVGCSDDLQGFATRLAKRIGLDDVPPVPVRNASTLRHDVQLSDADRNFFYQHNQVDMALYQWAKAQR